MTNSSLAELAGVHKRFGNVVALDGLDLQVACGELLAVLGPNGAGKTTAISLLLGLQQPDKGCARLFGVSPSLLHTRRQIGVMMQEVTLVPELRVRELIDLFASYYTDPFSPAEIMELTSTTVLGERYYGTLSAGQKRQAQFAIAICGRPKLLFLDEPTVGLDIHSREMMWSMLRQFVASGCSIVLTTHYLEEAEALATRVVVLGKGRMVASGSVDEMRGLVSRKRITCCTTVQSEEVKSWPGVANVTCEQRKLRIVARDSEQVVRRLLAADENLSDLEVNHAGLAEVFTELSRESTQ